MRDPNRDNFAWSNVAFAQTRQHGRRRMVGLEVEA